MDYTVLTDERLMELYQEDCVEAFSELYRRHSKLAYGYLIKKTMNEALSQDILQNTFLKLHSYRMKYDKNLPFLPWFFVIMKNSLSDHFKKSKEVYVADIPETLPPQVSSLGTTSSDFKDLISTLQPRYQTALQMRYIDDLDFNEIAEKLKTSEVNVRKIISRAIKDLRSIFTKKNIKKNDKINDKGGGK